MTSKTISIALVLLLGMGAPLSAQEIAITTPYGIDGGAAKAHQETRKVVIGLFQIAQTTTTSASQTAGGGGAYAKMSVSFGGVDPVAYQAVVKEGYDLAVKKLTAAGWEVLTPEQLKATGVKTLEGGIFEDKTITYFQAPTTQVVQDWSALGSNSFMSKAQELKANMINFLYGTTPVTFERGSRFAKRASVEATPSLTFGGSMVSYPIGRGGSPVSVNAGTKAGLTDFVGPAGIYETSARKSRYLGNAFGTHTLDIDQAKYLAYMRTMLLTSVEKSIDTWVEGMKK